MFRVAQIPPEGEKVVGESQHQSLHLRTGGAANFLRKLLDGLEPQLLGRHLLENLLDLLQLLFRNESLAKLLQVHRRALTITCWSAFIPCQAAMQNFVLSWT